MSTIVTRHGQTRCFSTAAKAHAFAEANNWPTYSCRDARGHSGASQRDQSEDYCKSADVLVHFYQGDALVTRRVVDLIA